MTRKRRVFGAAFKAKVALAACHGEKTTAQLAAEFGKTEKVSGTFSAGSPKRFLAPFLTSFFHPVEDARQHTTAR